MKLTDKELQEFWEWCGLPYGGYGNLNRQKVKSLPPLDLNNLFKYAVPKIRKTLDPPFYYQTLQDWLTDVLNGENPAQALCQAVKKARHSI